MINNDYILDIIVEEFSPMDKIESLRLFCRVSEVGSYSEVAREKHMSRSGISRAISLLEKQFDVQLFKRSTRALSLTDAGKELYTEAERLIRQFETMEDRLRRDRSQASGLLRIGIPGPLAERYILPELLLFNQRYPDIKLFFQVSENLSDIYKDELDMIIRMGPMRDSSLLAVQLSKLSLTLSASPKYLSEHPDITHPKQLKDHNCLCFRGRGRGTTWEFINDNQQVSVPVSGYFSADCGYSLRSMAIQGQGITAMPTPLQKSELESGLLRPVFKDWQLHMPNSPWAVHLLYHADRHQLNRVRAFIDFMKEPERLIKRCDDFPPL